MLEQAKTTFNVVTKQVVLKDTYQIIYLVKWVCLRCTMAVFPVHLNFQCYNLILKVVFILQSVLVITVHVIILSRKKLSFLSELQKLQYTVDCINCMWYLRFNDVSSKSCIPPRGKYFHFSSFLVQGYPQRMRLQRLNYTESQQPHILN